ncbi:hypothetical protein PYCC9005_000097 [Savitreella phatthalungensis]
MWLLTVPPLPQDLIDAITPAERTTYGKTHQLLPGKTYNLGRAAQDTLVCLRLNKTVSKRHCGITVARADKSIVKDTELPTSLTIADLGSKFGTFVDTRQIGVNGTFAVPSSTRSLTLTLAKLDLAFELRWDPVVLTLSNVKPVEVEAACMSLDWRYAKEYLSGTTTHVVTSKSNTAKVLHALAEAVPVVTSAWVRDSVKRASGSTPFSPVEENYHGATVSPTASTKYLPQDDVSRAFPPTALLPSAARATAFRNLDFCFFDREQHASLRAALEAAGGHTHLFVGEDSSGADAGEILPPPVIEFLEQYERPVAVVPRRDGVEVIVSVCSAVCVQTLEQNRILEVLLSNGTDSIFAASRPANIPRTDDLPPISDFPIDRTSQALPILPPQPAHNDDEAEFHRVPSSLPVPVPSTPPGFDDAVSESPRNHDRPLSRRPSLSSVGDDTTRLLSSPAASHPVLPSLSQSAARSNPPRRRIGTRTRRDNEHDDVDDDDPFGLKDLIRPRADSSLAESQPQTQTQPQPPQRKLPTRKRPRALSISQSQLSPNDDPFGLEAEASPRAEKRSRVDDGSASVSVTAGGSDDMVAEEEEEEVSMEIAPAALALERARATAAPTAAAITTTGITHKPDEPKPNRKPSKRNASQQTSVEERHLEEQLLRDKEARNRAVRRRRAGLGDVDADVDAEALTSQVDGVERQRNLGVVEFFHVERRHPPLNRTSSADLSHRPGWDPKWNGRKNFKKFRPQGSSARASESTGVDGDEGEPQARLMIRLVESVPADRGLLDKQWLDTIDVRDRGRDRDSGLLLPATFQPQSSTDRANHRPRQSASKGPNKRPRQHESDSSRRSGAPLFLPDVISIEDEDERGIGAADDEDEEDDRDPLRFRL